MLVIDYGSATWGQQGQWGFGPVLQVAIGAEAIVLQRLVIFGLLHVEAVIEGDVLVNQES